ncbi:caspase-3 [Drosophila biarmipes]|uniref:caspase-3 n=1 Tax=Drosophila biarmipes TaxID=125945 RepID=UPI0021CC6C7A|nr:caspase-3 [Drosophila biarmipes]
MQSDRPDKSPRNEEAKESEDGDSTERFQPVSMTFTWDSSMMEEKEADTAAADEEVSKPFQAASMVFQIDAQGEIVLSTAASLEPAKDLKPPLVVILHHLEFENKPLLRREGSSKDVETLFETFNRLKCEIEEVFNPKLETVREKVKKLALKNFNQLSGLVIVILSHGWRKEKITSCDVLPYDLDDDVLFPLRHNESLRGKPKILIVQACKDSKVQADSTKFGPDSSYYMKCYSTTEGTQSFRSPKDGTIYIQTFCQEMNQHALTKDFKVIMEEVNAKVEVESEKAGYKQVPSLLFSPWKPFCFGDYVNNAP